MGNNETVSPLNKMECYTLQNFNEETPRKMTLHILCNKKSNCIRFTEVLTGEKFPKYSDELLETDIKKKINLFSFMNYKIYDSPSKLIEKIKIKSEYASKNQKSVKCFFSEVVVVLGNERIKEQVEIIKIEINNNNIFLNSYFFPFFIILHPFDLNLKGLLPKKTFHYKVGIEDILHINLKNENNPEIFLFIKKLNSLFSYYNELGDAFSFINSNGQEAILKIEEDSDITVFINILMLGRSGAGKSTLINLLLDEKKSLEGGTGFSTTSKNIKVYQKCEVPLRFYDAKGIENEQTIKNYIKIMEDYSGKKSFYIDNLNAVFYCMEYKKEGTTIEEQENRLFEELVKLEIPILFIITKYPYNPEKKAKNPITENAREEGRKKIIRAINDMIRSILEREGKNIQYLRDYIKFFFVNLVEDLELENPIFGVDKIISFFTESVSEDDWDDLEESCKKNDEEKCKIICKKNPFLKYYSDFESINTRNKQEALKYLKGLKAGAFFSGWVPGLDIGMEYYYRHLFKEKLKYLYGFDFNEAAKYSNQINDIERNFSIISDDMNTTERVDREENLQKEKNKIKDEINKEVKNKGRNFATLVRGTGQAGGIAAQVGEVATQFAIAGSIQVASLALLPVTSIAFGAYSCYNIHKDCHKILDIYEKAFTPLKCTTLYNYIASFKKVIYYLKGISDKIIADNKEENENEIII